VVSTSVDATVRVWSLDPVDASIVGSKAAVTHRVLRGHSGWVWSATYLPDGKSLASASQDGSIRVWPEDLPRDPAELRAWLAAATR
jgi:WD40 repeat protein